jgi:transposase
MFIMKSMGQEEAKASSFVHCRVQAEIVELCQRGDRSVGQVAKDFELTQTAVRDQ